MASGYYRYYVEKDYPRALELCDLAQRNYEKILSDLAGIEVGSSHRLHAAVLRLSGLVHRYAGHEEAERAAWTELQSLSERESAKGLDRYWLQSLAWAKAGLGEEEAMVALIDSVDQILAEDKLLQLGSSASLATLHTLVGNKEQAIAIIKANLTADIGVITVHDLAMPHWDSLREEPEFKALLALN